jgi:predicted nucleic acid-binding protein
VSIVYADSSVFVALALREPAGAQIRRRLTRADRVVTSMFTEAELASALKREGVDLAASPLLGVQLIPAAEPLSDEIATVLAAGYLRGADCWHLAVALSVAPRRDLTFLTFDKAQRSVAETLGFKR